MIWGYNNSKAWGFPQLFDNDQPILFQAVGSILYVLTQKQNFYRINAEERTHEVIQEIEVEGGEEEVMSRGGKVHQIACGSDFMLTTNSAGNVYAKGANKYGQLGIGSQKPQPKFKCVDSFLDTKVQAIYAGSRSAFAFSDLNGNTMRAFSEEHNSVNEEEKIDALPRGMKHVQTSDGLSVAVNTAIWECYFPQEKNTINLPRKASLTLFKLLTGELSDEAITDWVNKLVKQMFRGQLILFKAVLNAIGEWLETGDDFDPEATKLIKGQVDMLKERVSNLFFTDESNSEMYRLLHVDRNIIQREILNPDTQAFVFPLPPAAPV